MRRTRQLTWLTEIALQKEGYQLIAGLDEVGRGALAGPVVAAAVMFPPGLQLDGVDDSKRLSPAAREALFEVIQGAAVGIGVGYVAAQVIDHINIRHGTLQAMRAAIEALPRRPEYLLIDGCDGLTLPIPQRTVIHGDQRVGVIAAASIVAKVTRDRLMQTYDMYYPDYGFAQHKGYGTAAHLQVLRQLGPSPIHRRTFRGVSAPVDSYG